MKVAEMSGGEQGDVCLGLPMSDTLEVSILGRVEGVELDKLWETIVKYLDLCDPEVAWNHLVLSSGDVEMGVKYQDEALSVNHKEIHPVGLFGMAPCNTA